MKQTLSEKAAKTMSLIKRGTELTEEIKRAVMMSCNVRAILESWGVQPVLVNGLEWRGYCPDHMIHDGHKQHQPAWAMNAINGDSICFSSSKSSNFIYIAKRIYNLDTVEDTIALLTNGNNMVLPEPSFVVDESIIEMQKMDEQRKAEDLKKGVDFVKRLLDKGGHISDNCLEYFANDGITKDTLDFLGVCSVESGWLEGRAVIPFLNENREICGYVAVNYMGKEWWVKRQYDKMKKIDSDVTEESISKEYRKTLYCSGFESRNHLYGYYEVLNGQKDIDHLMIVEGERDAMKMLQEGIHCVSIHGTKLKKDQIVMIKKMNPKILLLGFDMDKPGCIATRKAYSEMKKEMDSVFVVNFPGNLDPKKFSGNEVASFISNAIDHTEENLLERENQINKDPVAQNA